MNDRVSCTLGICLALLPFAVQGAEKRLDRTFSVAPGGTLKVLASAGDIVVTGTDSDQVVVHIRVTGSRRSVERMDLSAERSSDGMVVKAELGSDGWFGWIWARLDSQVTVEVPRRYNVDLKTSGGDLAVAQVEGDTRGRTSGGDIRLADLRGEVTMTTSGGNITAERIRGGTQLHTSGGDIVASAVTGTLEVKTSGGGIRLHDVEGASRARTSSGDVEARDLRGDADLQSSGGGIKAEAIAGKIRAHTSGGDIDVALIGANRGISASTSGGDIVLRLPQGVSAFLDASTSGGSVTSDFPVTSTQVRAGKLNGTINGGGEAILARTSGGGIRLRVRD